MISDHVNLLGANPLVGLNDEGFGPRFLDLGEMYSKRYRYFAHQAAEAAGISLLEGVYAVHSGPTYETAAEVRSLRNMGADLVGMSTVPEAIAARHAGLEVLAICVATNYAAGIPSAPLSHEDVLKAGQHLQVSLTRLLDGIIAKIGDDLSNGSH